MSVILQLSCGALGSAGVLRELKKDFHKVIGVDCRSNHHGQYLFDKFYTVPAYSEHAAYIDAIKKIVEENHVDFIIPGHTKELIILQEAGIKKVIASPVSALKIVTDKHKTFSMFPHLSPKFAVVKSPEKLQEEAYKMGFPEKQLCIKPCVSSGGRGFRILSDGYDKKKWVFEHKSNPYIAIDELSQINFPPLLLMEHLKNPNYHVEVLAHNGKLLKSVVSYRLEERFNFGFSLKVVNKPEYIEIAREVVEKLGLTYNHFIQIMDDKIIEIGGRMAGSVPIGLDMMRGAIQLAEGKNPLLLAHKNIKMIRYWKELFIEE